MYTPVLSTMLCLLYKQDNRIVSPESVFSYMKYSQSSFELLVQEIVMECSFVTDLKIPF